MITTERITLMAASITRAKAVRLLDELSHTARTEEHKTLKKILDNHDADPVRLDMTIEYHMEIWECFEFFNSVGMLDG